MLAVGLLLSVASSVRGSLTIDYYATRCPPAEFIVKNVVYQALRNDPTASAGLLRMHFHDCFVQVGQSVQANPRPILI